MADATYIALAVHSMPQPGDTPDIKPGDEIDAKTLKSWGKQEVDRLTAIGAVKMIAVATKAAAPAEPTDEEVFAKIAELDPDNEDHWAGTGKKKKPNANVLNIRGDRRDKLWAEYQKRQQEQAPPADEGLPLDEGART